MKETLELSSDVEEKEQAFVYDYQRLHAVVDHRELIAIGKQQAVLRTALANVKIPTIETLIEKVEKSYGNTRAIVKVNK